MTAIPKCKVTFLFRFLHQRVGPCPTKSIPALRTTPTQPQTATGNEGERSLLESPTRVVFHESDIVVVGLVGIEDPVSVREEAR